MAQEKYEVGDIVVGKANVDYITEGNEYEVISVSIRGAATVIDDDGDEMSVYPEDFSRKKPFVSVHIHIESTNEEDGYIYVTIEVDEAGHAALTEFVEKTRHETEKASLQAQIAELRTKLNAL